MNPFQRSPRSEVVMSEHDPSEKRALRRLATSLIVAAVIAGCAAGPKSGDKLPDVTPPTAVPIRYLALGDSYTIGESVAVADRWPNQLARALRAKGIVLGEPEIIAKTGWTTDELSSAIDAADPRGPYGLVTLLIGVNNQYRGRDADQYRHEFTGLLGRAVTFAGGNTQHVVVVSIPDWGVTPFAEGRDRTRIGREIDQFNAIARQETLRFNARFVDITPISRQATANRSLVADDGLHPSAAMYARWVEMILPEVTAALR
jgi:lysophospholipase L1-like esterase